jgi:hypothetical protein
MRRKREPMGRRPTLAFAAAPSSLCSWEVNDETGRTSSHAASRPCSRARRTRVAVGGGRLILVIPRSLGGAGRVSRRTRPPPPAQTFAYERDPPLELSSRARDDHAVCGAGLELGMSPSPDALARAAPFSTARGGCRQPPLALAEKRVERVAEAWKVASRSVYTSSWRQVSVTYAPRTYPDKGDSLAKGALWPATLRAA